LRRAAWFIFIDDSEVLAVLIMEAASSSETSVNFYQTTRLYNPEDSHLDKLMSSKHVQKSEMKEVYELVMFVQLLVLW
jgi:hypothetical protein